MPDALTGLRTHKDDLRDEIARHGQTCCLVDIDGFAWINAQDGYVEGDRVLVAIARRIEQTVANLGAAVFRVGGEEFLVLLPAAGRAALHEIAVRIGSDIRALAIPYRRRGCAARTILEVNVALLPVTSAFAERAFFASGLTFEARDWVAEGVYREKQQDPCTAGIVVDLLDGAGCPWA
jgi:diguanylate cyclase (GGDEF)-like protein